ncbi:glycosyltransferase [bacterium]|nr:glycosyltransferase [bacterium]
MKNAGIDFGDRFLKEDEESLLEELATEYAALFCVPGQSFPPYESVAREDRLLGDVASSVRDFYARCGLKPKDDLFFGYVKKDKGIETLLQAFSKVREKAAGIIEEVKLIVAGEGEMDHGQDEGLIRDLRYAPLDEAALYVSAADLVVLPYQKRSNSPVVQLAYTFGRPVITTAANNGVVDGKTGFIVERGDSDELAGKIIEIILCSSRAFRMSRYARRLSQTKYS